MDGSENKDALRIQLEKSEAEIRSLQEQSREKNKLLKEAKREKSASGNPAVFPSEKIAELKSQVSELDKQVTSKRIALDQWCEKYGLHSDLRLKVVKQEPPPISCAGPLMGSPTTPPPARSAAPLLGSHSTPPPRKHEK